MGSFAPQTLDEPGVIAGPWAEQMSAWVYETLHDRACDVSRKGARHGWCTMEEWNKLWEWYKANDRIPITDMKLAEEGYSNIIMLGVAWVVEEGGGSWGG